MQKRNKHNSALEEKQGIAAPDVTDEGVILEVTQKRKNQPSAKDLIKGILNGDITALSRAITLIESKNPKHLEKANTIIKGCLPHSNNSIRIGITGVPGVGKSTFIETLGKHLISLDKKVAVLAVDPSSTITKGSILGDKQE